MFNRRHYEFVAEVIRTTRRDVSETERNGSVLDKLAWNFSDKFKADNETFDADRFFNATVDGVVKRPRINTKSVEELEAIERKAWKS